MREILGASGASFVEPTALAVAKGQVWFLRGATRIQGDEVWLDGKRVEGGKFFPSEQLVYKFASIRSSPQIPPFVEEWGLVFTPALRAWWDMRAMDRLTKALERAISAGRPPESSDFESLGLGSATTAILEAVARGGVDAVMSEVKKHYAISEPVDAWLREASNVSHVLRLHLLASKAAAAGFVDARLREDLDRELSKGLLGYDYVRSKDPSNEELRSMLKGLNEEEVADFLDKYNSVGLVNLALIRLMEYIDLGLRQTGVHVFPTFKLDAKEMSYRVTQSAASSTLLGQIYHQLNIIVANRLPLLECLGCGRYFTPAHGNQKHCEPNCSSRKRSRKHYENTKTQVGTDKQEAG